MKISLSPSLYTCTLIILWIMLSGSQAAQAQSEGLVPDSLEYLALKEFYISTQGDLWYNHSNWPSENNWPATATSAEFGTWFGVTVQDGDVVTIGLNGNNLQQTLPASLANLSQMRIFSVGGNALQGGFPEALFYLPELQYLSLGYNQFSGEVPSFAAAQFNLYYLLIGYNNFTGAFPDLSSQTNLQSLSLAYTNFTPGPLPASFSNLVNLTQVYLSATARTGSLPDFIGNNLVNLVTLFLDGNQFSGTIPASIGNLSQLSDLYLNNNQFSGSIPAALDQLDNLAYLYLDNNQLSGSMPQELSGMQNIRGLSFENNQLSGSIPSEFSQLTLLVNLNVSGNQLTGIPDLSNLTLGALQLSNNKFSGPFPIWIASETSLTFLRLAGNQFSGPLPANFSSLVNLYDLTLDHNQFTGSFPDISGWNNLFGLNISNNQFTGDFPDVPSNLGFADITSNHFTTLPTSLFSINNNYYSLLYYNDIKEIRNLAADIANGAIHPKNSGYFNLSYNQLDFSQLTLLKQIPNVSIVNLPQNYIHDIDSVSIQRGDTLLIPSRPTNATTTITWYKKVGDNWVEVTANNEDPTQNTFLRTGSTLLDEGKYYWRSTDTTFPDAVIQSDTILIKMNLFDRVSDAIELQVLKDFYDSLTGDGWVYRTNWPASGSWPTTATSADFATWEGLQVEHGDVVGIGMNGGNLDGTIPSSLSLLSQLKTFYVGGNKLKGGFPTVLFSLKNLYATDIAYNELTGTIPSFDSAQFNLSSLSLGANQFTGEFPDLSSQTHLGWLSVTYMNLTPGPLPESMNTLINLDQLYIADSKRTGSLPTFADHLHVLSAENNQFSGPVPAKYADYDIQVFNVAGNQLSGVLPSFSNWSYLTYLNVAVNHFSGDFPSLAGRNGLTSLEASSNRFTSVPALPLSLPSISYFSFQDNGSRSVKNIIDSLAANQIAVGPSLQAVYLDQNYLDFAQLSSLKNSNLPLVLNNQKLINDIDTILFVVGDTLLIPSRPRNASTTTTWYKKVGDVWSDVSASNEDTTQGTFLISASPVSSEGLYYWSTTDTEFPDLIIQSDTIVVTIGERPALRIAALVRGVNGKKEGGSIQVSAQGGYGPYTYSWSSGETNSSINNKGLGVYAVTATDLRGKKASHTYELGYKVGWSRTTGVSQNNGGLTRTGNGAGGYSSNVLLTNDNGWLEFVVTEEQGDYMIGFGYASEDFNYTQVKAGFYVTLAANIYFLDQVNGSTDVIDTGIKYHTGDVFRVERDNGEVKYYYNGTLLRSSPVSPDEYVVKTSVGEGSSPAVVASFLSTQDAITRSLAGYDSLNHRIPHELKISRAGKKVSEAQERKHAFSQLSEGFSEDVFLAPPCMEGSYYTGFQLYYDLGDEQTRKEWLVQLDISFLHGADTLWTRPLQINLREQTFVATVFHDTIISCDGNYEYVVSNRRNLGNAPEDNIHLKLMYYRMDVQPFSVSSPITLNCDITSQKSQLGWNYNIEGPVAFDVEWVFIDSLENAAVFPSGTTFSTPSDAFAFKEPVRVTLSGNEFGSALSNYLYFYPKGYVWHRIRAVGSNPAYPEHRINGEWNYGCSAIVIDNQQPDKNWARQTVFAEEGKYKEVVRYFDGTTRERQVQTNLSTEEVTLVGESLYDYEGRPSVQILPVPSEERSLRYKSGFNQFAPVDPTIIANTSESQQKFNYDNRRLENSVLSQASGAARYYSASNNITTPITNKDYIPKANGYAYTQTEYTNDGTGRVSRQSGVGEVFRADGSNTTRSFYGSVAKPELVRLFGSNAGNATHYKKTMVLDANDQVSVTYQDQEGRTIATALAGDSPSNVDALESYTNLIPVPLTVDISDRNEKSSTAWVLSHTLLNAVPNTPYTFKYDLAALASQVDTIGCEGCVFDLEMVLTDPDGSPVSLASLPGNEIADGLSYLRSGITAASCSDTLNVNDIEFTLLLNSVGDYTLTKTLTPRELNFERMKELVEQTPAVLDQISQLTGLYSADSSECAICTESEAAIKEAIDEVSTQDCESILQQILSELQASHEIDETPYEPTQAQIEGHALYCQYQLCKKDIAGDVFDRELSRYEGWTTAIAAGHTNLLEQDPFFNIDSLSGYNYKSSMQNKVNDVLVGNVGYDSNGDGEQDGTTSYHGAIGAVTDPLNTAFYIDNNGNADVNGHHLLYAYVMSQRTELGETEYQKQLDAQRWSLYRSFYAEAKRRTKLEISEYNNCPGMKAQLGATDELPQTPDEVETWAAQQDTQLVNEVSVPELNTALYNIKTKCDVQFSPADSASISNHLQSYFNSNTNNFFRLLIKTDLAANAHLTAIQAILNNYSGCKLDSIAVDDPLTCLKTTAVTIPAGLQSAVPKWEAPTMLENKMSISSNSDMKVSSVEQEENLITQNVEAASGYETENSIATMAMKEYENTVMSLIRKEQDSISIAISQTLQKANTQAEGKKINNARLSTQNASLSTIPLPSQAEYDALVDLYNSTGGANWKNTINNQQPWNIVPGIVQSIENWYGISLNASGHVITITLNSNLLIGELPPSIGNLTSLEHLNLAANKLTGSIPSQIQFLTNIKYLYLYQNQLSGIIPSEIQYLTQLLDLNLGSNKITGTIPSEVIYLTNLVKLCKLP